MRLRGTCLLLAGGPGTGKTHLACAILADVIRGGHTGLFMAVSAALRLIRDAYSPRAQRSESEAFDLLTQCLEPGLVRIKPAGSLDPGPCLHK